VGGEHRRACERRFRRYPDLTAALSLVCPLSGTQRYSAVLSGTQQYSAVLSGTQRYCADLPLCGRAAHPRSGLQVGY
jgi:hypothetical protein